MTMDMWIFGVFGIQELNFNMLSLRHVSDMQVEMLS